ncbi:MAG: 30S ribosomal protein S14 [Nitrospira sp.]|nr:MAG: 30S ribosomal protein S14 [Nitrospira sp.]
MAKLSSILRNQKRMRLVKQYEPIRKDLKATLRSLQATEEQKAEARQALQRIPRNASPVRLRNRCAISGRVRGYLGRFNMSRIDFRLLALQGAIPGVRKSSW